MTSLTFIVAKIGQEAINYDAASPSLSRCWTNPAASKSQMKIKLSHQSVHKEGTTTTTLDRAILDADRAADLELLSNANSVS